MSELDWGFPIQAPSADIKRNYRVKLPLHCPPSNTPRTDLVHARLYVLSSTRAGSGGSSLGNPWAWTSQPECRMSSLVKLALGDSLGQMVCCVSSQTDGKIPGISKPGKLSRDDYQRHLRALEERKKRDEDLAQKKAERAAMRTHLRQKYQLHQNEKDTQQLRAVNGRVNLPVELAAIVHVGGRPENMPSLRRGLPGLPDTKLTELTNTAQATVNHLRQTTQRQCALM
ncbi:complexin-3-like [Heterodontus francisci]|uniref:complexin-3-like n=1 Tax=Heterodontus francisci TaxID=7792 RepID=UPI00355B5E39